MQLASWWLRRVVWSSSTAIAHPQALWVTHHAADLAASKLLCIGSADFLEALGVNINMNNERTTVVVNTCGFGFLFAQL